MLDQLSNTLPSKQPDVIISDIRMPGIDGLTLLEKIHQHNADLPVIIITAHSDLDTAVNAYQSGAFEYLPKPFDIDEVTEAVQKALDQVKELKKAKVPVSPINLDTDIIGEAPAMQEVFRAIGRLSRSSISVLINGQSGTGKELVAQALHKHSPRSDEPFIALNMAAIPKDLIESELFGHEKGAFTGANAVRQGRFAQADGGTLFLDEIGDMPIDIQTRLLRVLADGQFYRVGGHSPISADVRIIAATHQNLEDLVSQGRFREDLFHRLNVIRIHLPALKERQEDIPKLIEYFLHRAANELAVAPKTIAKDAIQFLSQQEWPGNIRQLENTCRGLTVMASGNEIQLSDMPIELRDAQPMQNPNGNNGSNALSSNSGNSGNSSNSGSDFAGNGAQSGGDWQQLLGQAIEQHLTTNRGNVINDFMPQFEKVLITTALNHCDGKKQQAAIRLGWGRNTLTRKLKELHL
ncbi:MAG: two-component system nitrogen regulation response regulator GlnG [Phenylobacterium sp.]